jgi:60S ribosome subunit biogenesis protein NIP7
MRPLTDDEMKIFFEKLQQYIGSNLTKLIDRKDEPHTFRFMNDRVYYLSEAHLKLASNVGRDHLISIGTCFGKFTKGGKFRLHITCLDYLAQYAKYKVWVKSGAEMSFLYGNNVTKAGLARITDSTPQYGGVVVYSMADVPLGFGVAAQPTEYCKDLEPTGNVVLHQGDVGEYLRSETTGLI